MTDTNPAKFTKLVTLLRELFQLDQPDLDFGIYRIMHAKAGEVTQFLERDLLPQVKDAFAGYQTADKSVLQTELAKAIEQAQALGADPDALPKVKELRERIANEAVDIGALESEAYDHLYSFFRRYYSEGDFLAKRVYKPGVYAIPYEGEEVTLHWANKGQYYIKSSEYLRDYAFRLKPEAGEGEDPMRVRFKLVDAAEGEHGNAKAAEGKDRVFVLSPEDFIAEVDGELELRFEYRPATLEDWPADQRDGKKKPPTQKELTGAAVQAVQAAGSGHAQWLAELAKVHVNTDGEQADYSRLEAHLRRYFARNTFDYFIHKDLGGFLRRELDFYIKNEVMHLDDVESEAAPKVEQYLSKIKVVRRIAGKIIDFLAQLENFQKKLWLKKKFVAKVSYLITLDRVPEDFYPEIVANEAQRQAWADCFAIDAGTTQYSIDFLKSHLKLMLDTDHFGENFVSRLIEHMDDVDKKVDGLLIDSDNFQALRLLEAKYRDTVDCIYIDPPYNTGKDEFVYKDQYQSSSWLAAINDRSGIAASLLNNAGVFLSSIADEEVDRLRLCLHGVFGRQNFLANFVWNNEGNIDNQSKVKINHEYVLAYCKNEKSYRHAKVIAPDIEAGSKLFNDTIENSITKNGPANPPSEVVLPIGFPASFEAGEIAARSDEWPHLRDVTRVRNSVLQVEVRAFSGWSSRALLDEFIANKCQPILDAKGLETWFKLTHTGAIYIYKRRADQSHVLSVIRNVGTVKKTSTMLERMGFAFSYPKPLGLISYLIKFTNNDDGIVLDYYAGSGTTGHAAISLLREHGVRRRYILVESGTTFDSIIKPRIQKAAYASDWSENKPVSHSQGVSHFVKVLRLESYEDALNNLALSRSAQQQAAFDFPATKAPDGLREQYLLRYQLDVESRGSASLLNIAAFTDPTAYKLVVKTPGSDESREVIVDLMETFNWLLGLTVQHIAAPRRFAAEFERDGEGRLQIKGRLKQDAAGPWWFRTVTGTTPEGRKTLVIWRKLTGNAEQDNLVLEAWFRDKQAFSVRDTEFDLIYVNGDNTLENIRLDDESWKVRLTEEDFQRLMFEGTEA